MTHGDEIRKSSDDELVELLVGIAMKCWGCTRWATASCPHNKKHTCFCTVECVQEWIKQEVEDE